jgi:NTE family protein
MGSAATVDSDEQTAAPCRTALVLSAGGMFGAYQAGVWSVLEGLIKPDILVGASIGSLNGWLIAGGNSGEQLRSRWLNLEPASQLQWQFPRNLSDGILDSTQIENWIRDIHAHCSPAMRYGLVATELRTMKPTLFEWPDLTWQHLAASCGVPVFLRQQRINGVLYADGGLMDPLPLWAALQMGATKIVTVNLLKDRPMILRAVGRAARVYSRHREPDENVEVVEINPGERLGTARDSMYWSRQNTERWIARGQEDAYAIKHLVVECFERV